MSDYVYIVLQEFHGDFDKTGIIGIFTDEEQAKSVTKLAYLKKISEFENNSVIHYNYRNNYNENENNGIIYDEDNDIYLYRYEKHLLNSCLLIN